MHDTSTVEARKAFSQSFMPQIVTILRGLYPGQDVKLADIVTDRTKATDVIIGEHVRVNVRARNAKYLKKYWNEITFRTGHSGPINELDKVLSGNSNLMFYSFIENDRVVAYWLVDLGGMRQDWIDGKVKMLRRRMNPDGSSFIPVVLDPKSSWATFKNNVY